MIFTMKYSAIYHILSKTVCMFIVFNMEYVFQNFNLVAFTTKIILHIKIG